MKIFIITLGSRGDVQPYAALGKGLKAAGHTVTLCTSASFEPFITSHGLNYGYMNDELIRFINSPEGREVMENTTGVWEGIKVALRMAKRMAPLQHRVFDDGWRAAESADPDLIIYHPKAFGGPHYAEKLSIPVLMAFYLPVYAPSTQTPCVGFPQWKLGPWYNQSTYWLVRKAVKLATGKYVKRWRAEQGMPPERWGSDVMRTRNGKRIDVLHGYSRYVVPPPSDWPPISTPTGFWFLDRDDDWQPPEVLCDFLAAGEPPVYVGFGSIAGSDPARTGRIVVDALRQAGVRGIIASGWGGLAVDDLPDTILHIEQAPHDWLFPRVAAVVHHGGCGTTAAGLRAGRPTVVCPFFADQPFWGRRVAALGVGSPPIRQKKLSAEQLADAIRQVTTDAAIRRKAEALGEKIRNEGGVAGAVAAVQHIGING